MKKIFINKTTSILSIILIITAGSCSKEISENVVSEGSSQKILITGVDANTITKTTLNGLVTSWNAGDKVGVYCAQSIGGSVNILYTASSTAFSSAFSGDMKWGTGTHSFYAYYPYLTGTPASSAVPISLPTAQTQVGNSSTHIGNYDFMVATPVTDATPGTAGEATTVNLRYNHVFSILEFQLKRTSGSREITKIKLTAPTSNLCFSSGTINIAQTTPGDGVAYTIAGGTGSKEITLTISGGVTPTADYGSTPKIYMMILPGDFRAESMTIGVEFESSGVFENYSKTGTIFERSKKYVVQMDVTSPTVTDVDNNVYNTIRIGSQTWMASNLKTTKYNDGTAITNITVDGTWYGATTGAWCDYNNTSSNSTTYGKLYNWYATVDSRNVCPTGWHVPTDAEWTTLTDYLGGLSGAGDKLKESGTTHWISNTAATNSSGFTALPGGYRFYDGYSFNSIGYSGRWWSSSPNGDYAFFRVMSNYGSNVESSYGIRTFGHSVRCVKD